jgi:hypothetical protein
MEPRPSDVQGWLTWMTQKPIWPFLMEIKKYSKLEMKRFAVFLNFRMVKLIFCVKEARCRRRRQPSDREAAPKGTASPDREAAP